MVTLPPRTLFSYGKHCCFLRHKEDGLTVDAYQAVIMNLDNILANAGGAATVLNEVSATESMRYRFWSRCH